MTYPIDDVTLAEAHPTREQLEQFATGTLEPSQVTWLEHHLSYCDSCCQQLESPPLDKLSELLRSSSTSHTSTNLRLIAGYQIQSELGRGGMGVVYRAIQPALRRQVALKMIAQGVHAGRNELSRFRREAEAAAALRHPYIAQVYDVGEIEGQPYISMELVIGRTLSEQLSTGPLRIDEATSLLIKLAQAMQHAHANGVIHRDLKPQNILLETHDSRGSTAAELYPKIVDFGLAKCIDSSATVTATGVIVGTPSYMSPEQATGNNEVVGPSSDVYSLGAVLYETLVGRPPFQGASPIETLTQVRTAEPVRPSMLRPGLPRDLETICLKCLEKSPADRYATSTALLEDLERFRNGHPISARPTGLATRTWKLAKRHPAWAWLFCVILLAGAGLAGMGVIYNAHLRGALREAESEQARADENFQFAFQAVEQMLDRVGFAKLADTPEMENVRAQLLTDAVGFYSKLIEGQPRADINSRRQYYGAMARLGEIQRTLGENQMALVNLQRAIDLQQKLSAEYPNNDEVRYELAISHINKGMVSNDAQEFRTAIKLLETLSTSMPKCKRELAQATNNLANLIESIDDKEQLHLSVLKLRQDLLRDSPEDLVLQYGIGETQHNLGHLYRMTGRIADAETCYREALQAFERLVAEHENAMDFHNALAETFSHLAILLHSTGRADEAHELLRRGVRIRKMFADRFPKLPGLREAIVRGLLNEAALFTQSSHFSKAAEYAQEAVDEATALVEAFSDSKYRLLEASCLTILATALSGEQKMNEAKSVFQRANLTYDAMLETEPSNPETMTEAGVQFMNYANVLRGETPQLAAEFNDRSIGLLEQACKLYPQRTDYQLHLFNAHGARATTYDALGNHREAGVSWNRAWQLSPPERRWQIGLLAALSLARAGEHEQAVQACKALSEEEGVGGADLYNLACVFGLAHKSAKSAAALGASKDSIKSYMEQAIELLSRTDTLEFLRVPANRQQLMVDADLETIRAEPAFDRLLEKLDR